ncbi:MAG: Ribonuclease HI-related protein 2 [uncultured Sulfurovum sp.]|uniref:ribonuclease H n=1 Tax=uncultured Sulfurovum sp. TaxID=269237 RepID=A0A6S6T4I8_9BACT|nr:MAG: Ribonuclease HI-related protein 2 [uncultured Sulfurovum sp.]
MKKDKDFIALGKVDGVLNEAQEALVKSVAISQADANLFLLLRGKFEPSVQEEIISNYKLLAQYHKDKKNFKDKKEAPKETYAVEKNGADITIYCDGACKGNPGKSGSGLAVYNGSEKPILLYGQYKEMGTNNTAELNALHKALLIAKEAKGSRVSIYCDSKYSIDCISNWAYAWKEKAWKKKGGEIKNLDIIQEAHALYDTLKERLVLKHVKGHAGVEGNELADRMAVYTVLAENEAYEVYAYDSIESILEMGKG